MTDFLTAALRNVPLHRLRTARTGPGRIGRVAGRWVKNGFTDPQEDALARLQVLEGVADLPSGTWSRRGVRGLETARRHFADFSVDPAWFDPSPSGMVRIIRAGVVRFVGEDKADEFVQNGLAGLVMEPDEKFELGDPRRDFYKDGPLLYSVAKTNQGLKDGVRTGRETPERVAAGIGGKSFRLHAMTEQKNERRRQELRGRDVRDESTDKDGYPDRRQIESPAAVTKLDDAVLLGGLLTSRHDPLARLFRDKLRGMWSHADGRMRQALDMWMDAIERGDDVSHTEIAEAVGLTQTSAVSRYVLNLKKKILRDPEMTDIYERYLIRHNRLASRHRVRRA